jgi:hypothetical protein
LNRPLTLALVLALAAGMTMAADLEDPAFGSIGSLTGQVKGTSAPLSFSKVYVYHLSDQSLSKVITDETGNFRFNSLPAGLYKVIAFKDGFVPAIALITRSKREAEQFLNLELATEEAVEGKESGFWAVREKIPSDVLRDLEVEEATRQALVRSGVNPRVADTYTLETSMQAIAGVDQNLELGAASLTGGRVGVQGEIADLRVGLTGNFVSLQKAPGSDITTDPSGRAQSLSVRVDNRGATGIRVSSTNNYMNRDDSVAGDENYVGLARHQVSWSQDLGSLGHSDFSAEYAEENNFFRRAPIEPYGIPNASRLWRVEGSYSASPTQRSTVTTGFRYRERQSLFDLETRHARESLSYIPSQRVDLFGQGGMQVSPGVLVEIGLYSTMRDGSLSFSPSGGMVFQLGDNWRAQASGTVRVHDQADETLPTDFNTALFGQQNVCDTVEEYCYRLKLAHQTANVENMSVGLVHRRYAETLHLYFNEDFFSRLESLYLVEGDDLPEVQLAATRRLAPKVLARLSSNLAAGGGGVLYAMDQTSYENQVRYLVTSLDTQFEHTSTGVFVAFHHLAQQLNPIEGHSQNVTAAPEMELERLQVMLTQDLDVLSRLASQWAVHLNMELSRGTTPESDPQFDDEELRKRVMGGLTVSF